MTDASGGSRNVEIGSSGGLPGGTVVLGGANTFTGNLTIPSATLSVATINNTGVSGPLGAGSTAIVLGDASGDTGTLAYTGPTATTSRQFSLAAGGSGDFDVSNNGSLSITSAIAGGGSLCKTNSGLLVLSNPVNGYSGSTNFNGGEIGVSTLGSLGSNPVLNFNGGGIQFEAVFDPSLVPMTFNGAAIFDTQALSGSQSITFSNPVGNGGVGSLVKTGAGLLTLAASNTYGGGATVSGGTLAIDSDAALGAAGGAVFLNGGTLRFAAAGINTARTFGLGPSSGTIDTDGFNATISSNINNSGGGFYGVGLTKIGDGVLTLSGSNTFLGGANVLGGTLSLMSTAAVGNSYTPPAVNVSSGATLQVQNGINPRIKVTLNGSPAAGGGALLNYAGNTTLAGPIILGSSATIDSSSGTLTLASTAAFNTPAYALTVGGAGSVTIQTPLKSLAGLTKNGTGTLVLTASESYAGPTTLSAGTLQLSGAGSLPTGNSLTIGNGGALDVDGHNQTLGALNGVAGAAVTNSGSGTSSVLTINLAPGATATYAGALSNGNGTLGLCESGGGLLVLSGIDNYTGGTTVISGTLDFTSLAALPKGLLTIEPGGEVVFGDLVGAADSPSGLLDAGTSLESTDLSSLLGSATPSDPIVAASADPGNAAAATPEPGSLALLGAALGALALWSIRRRFR